MTPKEYSISHIRKVPDPYFGNIFYLKTGLTLKKNPRIHQPSNQEGLRSIFGEYLLFENGFDIGKYPQESTNPHTRKLSNSYFGNIFYLKPGLTWEHNPKNPSHEEGLKSSWKSGVALPGFGWSSRGAFDPNRKIWWVAPVRGKWHDHTKCWCGHCCCEEFFEAIACVAGPSVVPKSRLTWFPDWIYACMYLCMYVCKYVWMNVCMGVCM